MLRTLVTEINYKWSIVHECLCIIEFITDGEKRLNARLAKHFIAFHISLIN